MISRTLKKGILILMIFLLAAQVLAQLDHYYILEITYDNNIFSLKKISVEPLPEKIIPTEGRYIAEVISFEDSILNMTFFEVSPEVLFDYYDPETGSIGGGSAIPNKTQIILYVPYYSNAKEINIYDWKLVQRLQINVSSYARELPAATITEEIEASEEIEKPAVQKAVAKIKSVAEEEPATIIAAVGMGAGLLFIFMIIVIILRRKR